MKTSILLLLAVLAYTVNARSSGGRFSGSRSGGSSYRYSSGIRSTSSRFTSSSGYNNAARFSYTRSTGMYRYNGYSGNRFGKSIRRTTYWPVFAIWYGSPFRAGSSRPYRNSRNSLSDTVQISDRYTKQDSNSSITYYCVDSNLNVVETCYESIGNNATSSDTMSQDDKEFDIEDGGCCENKNSGQVVCCIIELNKATALNGIIVTLTSLVITSTIFGLKICR